MTEEAHKDTPLPSPKKLKTEAPPPCPRCAAMTEFTPVEEINALVETCRDLIMRIEATEGPRKIFTCINPISGFRFQTAKTSASTEPYSIFSDRPTYVDAIAYTTFGSHYVSTINQAESAICGLIDAKEKARREVSPERYKNILVDVIDRLLHIQDLLSDTHTASTVGIEHLNYELKKLLHPYRKFLFMHAVIDTPHMTFDPTNTQCQFVIQNGICGDPAVVYCNLCKMNYCEWHIRHSGNQCYMNQCVKDCGCGDSDSDDSDSE